MGEPACSQQSRTLLNVVSIRDRLFTDAPRQHHSSPATTAAQREEQVQFARIEHGEVSVTFRDNLRSPQELSGIDALFNIKHAADYDAYDPDARGASAGSNFEHIISGHPNPNNKFTPRHGRYTLHELPDGLNEYKNGLPRSMPSDPRVAQAIERSASTRRELTGLGATITSGHKARHEAVSNTNPSQASRLGNAETHNQGAPKSPNFPENGEPPRLRGCYDATS
jgi:hypothetical protein